MSILSLDAHQNHLQSRESWIRPPGVPCGHLQFCTAATTETRGFGGLQSPVYVNTPPFVGRLHFYFPRLADPVHSDVL